MKIVIDASAVLAILLGEPGSDEVEAQLDDALISTVNLAEVVAALARDGNPEDAVRAIIADLAITTFPPDEILAMDAGLMRASTDAAGLSLGDRFCLATAHRFRLPVLTADRAWLKVARAVGVDVRTIR